MFLYTIEYYDKNPNKEVCWSFIDAEKAFDNLNWDFMLSAMEELELGILCVEGGQLKQSIMINQRQFESMII